MRFTNASETKAITEFKDKYLFLSNFYIQDIEYEGIVYSSAETAFQLAKLSNRDEKIKFSKVSPSEAKRIGRHCNLPDNWEDVKCTIMYNILKEKFSNKFLKIKLVSTCGFDLIEGNTWKDTYWGVCNGVGENNLGKILMRLRDEFINEEYKKNY